MSRPVRIHAVRPTGGTKVELEFTDGTVREVDLAPFLVGPVFDPIRSSPDEFRRLAVDPELGTIVWPNGADIDPDVLYLGLTPASRAPR